MHSDVFFLFYLFSQTYFNLTNLQKLFLKKLFVTRKNFQALTEKRQKRTSGSFTSKPQWTFELQNNASPQLPVSSFCFKFPYVCTDKSQMFLIQSSKETKNNPALMVSSTRRRLVEVWHRKTSVALKNCKCFSSHLLCTDEIQDT